MRQFDWEISYSAEEYIRLLGTFSGHIAMDGGNETGCAARSGVGLPSSPTAASAGTGQRSCRLRDAALIALTDLA